jgi:AraC-like DNA-binding protein
VILSPPQIERLIEARELLAKREAKLTVAAVARQVGMSPYHFIRRFRALFGVTPHQYRIKARLEDVKAQLAESSTSVTDLCFDAGLASLGTFSGQFSRRTGISPRGYRERSRHLATPSGCIPLMSAAFSQF